MSSSIRQRFMYRSNTDILLPQTMKERNVIPTLPRIPKHKKIFGLPKRALSWLYSTSLGLLLLFFIGFNTVLPIDAIVQSKKNLALNTLVVMICCVIFIVVCLILYSIRVFVLRLSLQDIPKLYIPDHYNDLPISCYNYIQQNLQKCQDIVQMAQPKGVIKHPGLYHRSESSSNTDSGILPNFLVYEEVLRAFGDLIQYKGFIFKNVNLMPPKNATYCELLEYFHDNQVFPLNSRYVRAYMLTYERLRFSGKEITEDEFLDIMELFVKAMNFTSESQSQDLNSPLSVGDFKQRLSVAQTQHSRRRSSYTMLSKVSTDNSVLLRYPIGEFPSKTSTRTDTDELTNELDMVDSSFNDFYNNEKKSDEKSAGHISLFEKKSNNNEVIKDFQFPKFEHLKQMEVSDASTSSSSSSSSLSIHSSIHNADDDFYKDMKKPRKYQNGNSSLELLDTVSSGSALSINTTRLHGDS